MEKMNIKERLESSYNITWLDSEKYKNDDDLEELLENEDYEDSVKFIEKAATKSKKNPFLKRIKAKIGSIDQSRSVFDMVFIWRTLDAKCKEVVTEAKVKWQPSQISAESWDNLEAQAVAYAVSTGVEKDNINAYLKLPTPPWKYVEDFYRDLGITETEAKFFSRIEIRALDNRVVLVVYDKAKYINSRQMFWEIDGECEDKESNLKIDLAKKGSEFTAIADSKDNSTSQKAIYNLLRSQVDSNPKFWLYGARNLGHISDKDLIDEIAALRLFDAETKIKHNEEDDMTF